MAEREAKKRNTILDRAADKFDLPGDALGDHPRVTLVGGGWIMVENHKGLVDYGAEEIAVAGMRMVLKIIGSDLELRAMNTEALLITGDIFRVELVY